MKKFKKLNDKYQDVIIITIIPITKNLIVRNNFTSSMIVATSATAINIDPTSLKRLFSSPINRFHIIVNSKLSKHCAKQIKN
jgi:hypothetical protein